MKLGLAYDLKPVLDVRDSMQLLALYRDMSIVTVFKYRFINYNYNFRDLS